MEFVMEVTSKIETLQTLATVYFLHVRLQVLDVDPDEQGGGAPAQFKVTKEFWQSVEVGDQITFSVKERVSA